MEFWRNAGAEALQQARAWVIGSLLFTAIMAAMGWGGVFSERAHGGHKDKRQTEAVAGKKPVIPADWPSARADSGGH